MRPEMIDINNKLTKTSTLTELTIQFRSACEDWGFDHISFWGVDKQRQKVFYVLDISDITTIHSHGIRVIDYDKGFLGKCVNTKIPKIQIITGSDKVLNTNFIAKSFLKKYNIEQIIAIPILHRIEYNSVFLLASKHPVDFTNEGKNTSDNLSFLLELYVSQYARIRNKQYRELLLELAENSLSENTIHFVKSILPGVKRYFNANSFSVWQLQQDGKLHNLFFSDKDADPQLTYEPGEGATGTCFREGKSFLAHRMSDLLSQEGIPWKGKVSDLKTPPKEGDHGLFAPILSVKSEQTFGEPAGVVRIILPEESCSFWPNDLEAIQTIAKVIALRFSHDLIFNRLNDEKYRLLSLLNLSSEFSKLGQDADFSKDAFDSLVSSYSLLNIAYLVYDVQQEQYDIKFNNYYSENNLYFFANATIKAYKNTRCILSKLPNSRNIALILGQEKADELHKIVIFILEFSTDPTELDITSLEVFSRVLEIAWENSKMYRERQIMLEKWERAEAANRAGIIAREFAHEVSHRCKTIFSWISNSNRENKYNTDALLDHAKKLDNYAKSALDKSDFNYKSTFCYLNNVVRDALRSYGVRLEDAKLQGHKLKVSYSPYLWNKNHERYLVDIDPDAMVSVVRNLINNSIEQYALYEKRGPIEITTELVPGEECRAYLYIKDYAGGVSPDMKNKMWSPFETNKPNGYGIGLFSVETIVHKRMEGAIDEIGAPPSAEFRITLDAIKEEVTL